MHCCEQFIFSSFWNVHFKCGGPLNIIPDFSESDFSIMRSIKDLEDESSSEKFELLPSLTKKIDQLWCKQVRELTGPVLFF